MMPLNALFHRRNLPAWLILLGSLLVTVFTWQGLDRQSRDSARQQFELRVQATEDSIRQSLRENEQVLLGTVGLFAAGGEVTREMWRDYVKHLQLGAHSNGFQRLGFVQVVPAAQLAAHEASLRAQGFPAYAVHPPGRRHLYSAVIYMAPEEGGDRLLGFDMLTDERRGEALRQAAQSGGTTISDKLDLIVRVKEASATGFAMYVPVYRPRMPLDTLEDRWAATRGFVYSVHQAGELMRDAFRTNLGAVDFAIYDGETVREQALLYASAGSLRRASPPLMSGTRSIDIYGHVWTIQIDSSPALDEVLAASLRQHLWLLLLGCGASVLLFLTVSSLASRRAQAEEMALQMTDEIRQREAQLRLSEARLNEAQHTAQVGSWELDLSSGQLFWTDEIFNLFEIDKAKFSATYEGFLGAIHPQDRDDVNQAYADSLANRQPYEIKHRLLMADGRVKWVHERCSTDFDAGGKPLRSRGTVQDITQLTDAERVAQESARHTQSILDNAVDGIITIDELGTVQSFNRAAEGIFGYAAGEVIGRNVNMLMPEPYQSQHDGYLKHYRDTGEKRVIGIGREVEGRRRDGSVFPLDLAVSRSEHRGQPLFIGLVRDITERKRVEKMKAEFVSTVSHELRTPLTSIRGALGLLSGGAVGELPPQVNAMIKIASNNTERLLLLINDILDMQKIESGQLALRFQHLEASPFLRQVLQDLAGYGEQHKVKFVLSREVDGLRVYADKDRLTQVLANLLSNAAKYSPIDGQVEVTVDRLATGLRISVTDHGPGIAPEFQPRLFERFTQADSSDTRQKGGTGLGLAITKAIVEKHGGQIGFTTQVGAGSTFYVDLPLLAGEFASTPAPAPVAPPDHSRVLVVEDDPDVAALIQRMLADAGFESDIAHDAAQARALLGKNRKAYALMTLDIVLPGEDGISLFRSLRSEAATHDLPVVVLSVKVDEARQEINGGAVGVVDWLAKPIDQQRLVDVVRSAAKPGRLPRVLHVEDDADIVQVVAALLQGHCELASASTVVAARAVLQQQEFDLVLLDVGLPDGSGLDLLDTIEHRVRPPKVVVFSAQDVPPSAAQRVGAVMVKSRTSNEELLRVLREAMGRG